MLHNSYPEKFPYGHRSTVLAEVICEMLKSINGAEIWIQSLTCNVQNILVAHEYVNVMDHVNHDKTISNLIHSAMEIRDLLCICKYCNNQLDCHAGFVKAPKIMAFIINLIKKIGIDKTIKIMNKIPY